MPQQNKSEEKFEQINEEKLHLLLDALEKNYILTSGMSEDLTLENVTQIGKNLFEVIFKLGRENYSFVTDSNVSFIFTGKVNFTLFVNSTFERWENYTSFLAKAKKEKKANITIIFDIDTPSARLFSIYSSILPFLSYANVKLFYVPLFIENATEINEDYCMEIEGKAYCSRTGVRTIKEKMKEMYLLNEYGFEKLFLYYSQAALCKNETCLDEVFNSMNISVNESKMKDYLVEAAKKKEVGIFVNGIKYELPENPFFLRAFICRSLEKKPEICKEIEGKI